MFQPRVDQKQLCCLQFTFFYWGGAARLVPIFAYFALIGYDCLLENVIHVHLCNARSVPLADAPVST